MVTGYSINTGRLSNFRSNWRCLLRKLVLACSLVFLSVSLSAACNPPSGKLVLHVHGIPGPSTVCPHGIDLASARINVGSAKGSGTAVITKSLDSSSPGLLEAMAGGRHFPTLILTVPAPDGKSSTYELNDALISSFRQTASPASETLTFSFARVEGHQYQPASEGRAASVVDVTGPGPYSFQGASQPVSVQLSMKLDDNDTKITSVTITGNARNRKVDLQMVATVPAGAMRPESARPGGVRYNKATVTLNSGSTAFSSYLLEDVKVSSAGNQMSLEFAKIDFRFGPPSSQDTTGRFKWDIKNNKKA